jgi:hypothetical protein
MVYVILKDGHCSDRKGCEDHVVKGHIKIIEDWAAGVKAVKCKIKLRNGEDEVLVEEVKDEFWLPNVVESSMMEDKVPEMFELIDSKVRVLRRTHSFFTDDANSDVSLEDHGNIVSSIAHAESCFGRIVFLDHPAEVGFLLRRDSTCNNCFTRLGDWDENVFKLFVRRNFG